MGEKKGRKPTFYLESRVLYAAERPTSETAAASSRFRQRASSFFIPRGRQKNRIEDRWSKTKRGHGDLFTCTIGCYFRGAGGGEQSSPSLKHHHSIHVHCVACYMLTIKIHQEISCDLARGCLSM